LLTAETLVYSHEIKIFLKNKKSRSKLLDAAFYYWFSRSLAISSMLDGTGHAGEPNACSSISTNQL
jgi:hypothetical protein